MHWTDVRVTAAITALLVLFMIMPVAFGQDAENEEKGTDDEKNINCLRIANLLDISPEIGKLDKLEKEGRWGDVVNLYEELIKGTRGKLVMGDGSVYRQAGEYLRERMAGLGPRAREIYRIKHDRAAGRAYEAACKALNETELQAVIKDYPLSTFTDDALNLLAEISAERGDFESAINYLEILLTWHSDSDIDMEEMLIRAAWYGYYSGMFDKTRKYLDKLDSDDGKKVENATRFGLPRLIELTQQGNSSNERNGRETKYVEGVPGGGFDRAGVPKEIDLGDAIFWQGSLTNIGDRKGHNKRAVPFRYNKRLRAVSPGANDYRYQSTAFKDRIYSQTEVGVNIYNRRTGRLVMDLKAPQGSELFPGLNTYLAPTVTEENIYTNFVYEVSDSEDYNGILVKAAMPRYTLCAFERKSGKLKWAVHEDREFNSRFAGKWYSIPCSPVISGNLLIVEVKTRGQLAGSHMAAFDKDTGEMKWVTPLCSNGTELTMFGYDARDPLSTMPACSRSANPTVFCCTNLGAVFALDARTGAVKWARQYDEIPLRAARNYYAQMRNISWVNSPPVCSDGVLVLAPLDSQYAYGLDVETGKIKWRFEQDWQNARFRYVAGAANGMAVIAGAKTAAIELKTGKVRWVSRHLGMTDGGPRGLVTETQVMIPHGNVIYVFSLSSGKLIKADEVSRTRQKREDGNLLAVGEKILVTGRAKVTFYRKNREKSGK